MAADEIDKKRKTTAAHHPTRQTANKTGINGNKNNTDNTNDVIESFHVMFLEKNWRNYCAAMHALQELNHITLHVVLKLLKQFEPDNREELDRYTFSSSWEEVHPTTTRLLLML